MRTLSTRVLGKALGWLWAMGYFDSTSVVLHESSEVLEWVDRFYPGGLIAFILEMQDD